MRTAAQIDPVALAIQRDRLVARQVLDDLCLVFLALFLEQSDGIVAVHHLADEFVAARNDLALDSGEYRLANARDGGLARYQITLPLRGGYAQVRSFLDQVLTQIPAAALEEVTIRRDSVGARATETRVRLTLYLAGGK